MSITRMQQKRGTAAEWAANNPVLADGEIGFERDTGVLKVGNGVDPWNQLVPILKNVLAPTAAEWASQNPVLGQGVVGIERDTGIIKIGDGSTSWNSLPEVTGAELASKAWSNLTFATKGRVANLLPSPLKEVSTALYPSGPRPISVFDGIMWGGSGTDIYRSSDQGLTWTLHCAGPAGGTGLNNIFKCSDGEVLVCYANGLHRSTGWSNSGTPTPTWTLKATPNGASQFQGWSLSGDGTKFITTEYAAGASFADSRYARASFDSGQTWAVIYDSVAVHGSTLANASHLHGCTYDPWSDRFYISEGHGSIAGLYSAPAEPNPTFSRAAGLSTLDPSPTFIVATDEGLVCSSDSPDGGLYGVLRNSDASKESFSRLNIWKTGFDGTSGFGVSASRDPNTGIVYFGYRVEKTNLPPVIMAGTPVVGSLVYKWPESTITAYDDIRELVVQDGVVAAIANINGSRRSIRARLATPGAPDVSLSDPGNVLGGKAKQQTSVASGVGASVSDSTIRSVAVGPGATVTGAQDAVAVGQAALAANSSTVAVGKSASANVANSTAVGDSATVAGANGVAVGKSASAPGGSSVAVGHNASAPTSSVTIGASATLAIGSSGVVVGANGSARNNGVSVGQGSTHSGNDATTVGQAATSSAGGTAIGKSATVGAGHTDAVALGKDTSTTASKQVAVGDRHLELLEIPTDPSAPATNGARLYMRDNGSGKTQLVVRFATGAIQVLATEP